MAATTTKFRFQLATLLKLRETERDQCQTLLAEAARADDALAEQLTQVELERRQWHTEIREAAAPGAVDVERLAAAHRYVGSLLEWEASLQRQRAGLAAEIDRRRQALVKANQEVQALEKLEQRRLERHRLEEGRREAKQLDEAALQAAAS